MTTSEVGKICKSIGCRNFSYSKHGYCSNHESLAPKYTFVKSRQRNPIYDTAKWRKLRLFVLKRNPLCNCCRVKPAKVVHHLKEARQYPELAFDISNLEALCDTCHNRESQKESMKSRTISYEN